MVATNLATDAHCDNVLAARISRQLTHLIYASLAVSTSVFACSMVLFGYASLWLSVAGYGLVLIHHLTILGNRWKQRKLKASAASNSSAPRSSPIPITSRRFVIFSAWFIALLYTAAFALVVMNVHYMIIGWFEYWDSRFISAIVEAIFLGFEIPLMIMIALWCMKERRAMLGVNSASWYHLPQYQK